ncbi:MAG TPA: PAS domain S-box protein [Opitutaceae bacterium]|nr:PAS domain S-box protein [Opitutaceae bacterium]
MSSSARTATTKIVLPYLLFSGLWILFSDGMLEQLVPDPAARTQWSIYKGWVFVGVTAMLLTLLLRWEFSARERAQALLRSSEERLARQQALLSAVASATSDAIYVKDPEGRYLLFNEAAARLAGCAIEEAIGRDDTALFSPEDAARIIARDRGILAQTEPQTYEEAITIAGVPHIFLSTKGPVRDAQGRLVGIFGIARDISERKRAEAAVREREVLLRLFVEHAPAAIAMFDREMRYLVASRRWLDDYGLGERDLRGRPQFDVLPSIGAEWERMYQRALAGEVVTRDDARFNDSDGSTRWMRWEARPWHRNEDEIGGVVVFSEDTTARRAAADLLRESELRFRSVVENAPEAIFIQTQGRFSYLNELAVRLFGAGAAGELLGRPVLDFFAEGQRAQVAARIRQLNEGLTPVPVAEEICLRLDQKTVEAEVSAVPFRFNGERGALVFARQITVRKESERIMAEQLSELRRWHAATLGREHRVLELKAEVNRLLAAGNQPPRYSVEADPERASQGFRPAGGNRSEATNPTIPSP